MKLKTMLKTACAFLMAFLMTNAHAVAALEAKVEAQSQMISAVEVANDLDRAQAEQRVQDLLSRSDVQEKLIENGLTREEASQRIASLSESELRQLTDQMDQAKAGGLLVEILLIVLIIYLIKRI